MDKFTSVLQDIAMGKELTTNVYIARNGFLYIDGKRVDYTGYINLNGERIKIIMGQAIVPSPYAGSVGCAISVEDGSYVDYEVVTDTNNHNVLARGTYNSEGIILSRNEYDVHGNCTCTSLYTTTYAQPTTEIHYRDGRPVRMHNITKEETYTIVYGMSSDLQRIMVIAKYVKGMFDTKYIWCFDTGVLTVNGVSYVPKHPIPEFYRRIIPRVQYDGLLRNIIPFDSKVWNKI